MNLIDADVAVVGSGFAGSLVTLALLRQGRRVALVERGRHPRFAIGESSTPLANLLLEQLADRYRLPGVRVFSKWGTWRRARPDVAVGLKRGFTFVFHREGEPFADALEHENQLLVGASPSVELSDTHWYRPDFDAALVAEALAQGAIYLDHTRLETFRDHGSSVRLEGVRAGHAVRISAQFVIDASGSHGFLSRHLGLYAGPSRWMPPTRALYTHFRGVDRWDHLTPLTEVPPYPPDDAALHHVFPGGWIWVLRFCNGCVSGGAVLTDRVARSTRVADGGPAWRRLLARLPTVEDQFRNAEAVRPFVYAPRVTFRVRTVHGRNWALLPSAAGVIDPLLSTGIPLTLLGIARLLQVLETTSPGQERQLALGRYAERTQDELDVTEQLVASLYATMADPLLFKRLTLLYFAAASYSEAAHRLDRPDLAPGFLLHDHPRFGPELRACASQGTLASKDEARAHLLLRIDRAIEPFDTAGLLDRERRDWYPVLAADLLASAAKLETTPEKIRALLARAGFSSQTATPA